MSTRTTLLDDGIQAYVNAAVRGNDVLERLRVETSHLSGSQMQIGPDQGALMQLLVKALGVRRYLEIGVFTGYSSLAVALALPEDGHVLACDVSDEWTAIARRYWRDAGVEKKIDLRLGPALETLDAAIRDGRAGSFDLAFIDADKANVDAYYERCMMLLRAGGMLLIDNVLWDGAVIDPSDRDPQTVALRAIANKAREDERVDMAMLTVGDGILMARKR